MSLHDQLDPQKQLSVLHYALPLITDIELTVPTGALVIGCLGARRGGEPGVAPTS